MSRAEIRLRTHFCTLFWILRTSSHSKSKISLFLLYLIPNLNCSCRSHDLALKALKKINSLDFEAGNDVKSKNKPQKWVRRRILPRRRPVGSSDRDIARLSLAAAEKTSPLKGKFPLLRKCGRKNFPTPTNREINSSERIHKTCLELKFDCGLIFALYFGFWELLPPQNLKFHFFCSIWPQISTAAATATILV